jgi:hypothetical protein
VYPGTYLPGPYPPRLGDGLKLLEFGDGAAKLTALAILQAKDNGRGLGDLHVAMPETPGEHWEKKNTTSSASAPQTLTLSALRPVTASPLPAMTATTCQARRRTLPNRAEGIRRRGHLGTAARTHQMRTLSEGTDSGPIPNGLSHSKISLGISAARAQRNIIQCGRVL